MNKQQASHSLDVLYGINAVREAIVSRPIAHVLVREGASGRRLQEVFNECREQGIPLRFAPRQALERLAQTAHHQDVVAVCSARGYQDLSGVIESQSPALLLVLDGVQDPHNLGACLRSADAFGVHAVIAPKDRAVGLNATVEKVACGAAETVPYITVTNLARTLRELKERDIWVVGADSEARTDLHGFRHSGALAWVLGAEGEGLRRLTKETCDELVRIPMRGSVESLNVSVSAGVCLYEARRQREGGA